MGLSLNIRLPFVFQQQRQISLPSGGRGPIYLTSPILDNLEEVLDQAEVDLAVILDVELPRLSPQSALSLLGRVHHPRRVTENRLISLNQNLTTLLKPSIKRRRILTWYYTLLFFSLYQVISRVPFLRCLLTTLGDTLGARRSYSGMRGLWGDIKSVCSWCFFRWCRRWG